MLYERSTYHIIVSSPTAAAEQEASKGEEGRQGGFRLARRFPSSARSSAVGKNFVWPLLKCHLAQRRTRAND